MLRALFDELVAQGSVMMVVDQPRNIGALSIAVARDAGINVAYLPGLRMLAAFDADLAVEENRISGRIRSVLLSVHPALERAIGKHLYRSVALTLLAEFGGPVGFAAASRRRYDGLRNAPPRATATRQPRRCPLPWASRR